jgi:hypothetical protein
MTGQEKFWEILGTGQLLDRTAKRIQLPELPATQLTPAEMI